MLAGHFNVFVPLKGSARYKSTPLFDALQVSLALHAKMYSHSKGLNKNTESKWKR